MPGRQRRQRKNNMEKQNEGGSRLVYGRGMHWSVLIYRRGMRRSALIYGRGMHS